MKRWMCSEQGHVLLAAVAMIIIFSLLGLTSIFLAGQDLPGIAAMKDEQIAQQLGEAASELVIGWFHDERTVPAPIAPALMKRQGDLSTGPMFFDAAGRSQFAGTAEHPDVLLDAAKETDNIVMNNPPSGFSGSLRNLGKFAKLKIYGPLRPGLLGTVEATAVTSGPRSLARTISFQLGTISLPAIRAPLQVGQNLGVMQSDGESRAKTHWGSQRIGGNLVVRRLDDIVAKTSVAPVTGQSYDQMERLQDRWVDYWIGGTLSILAPPPGQGTNPIPPSNVLAQQTSTAVRLDQWPYEAIKRVALRYGTYYRLDRRGRLHGQNAAETDEGLAPSDVLRSIGYGDHRGMVFIDTMDGEPARSDNLGSLVLEAEYLEAVLVVQGHVVLKPRAAGRSIPVLSPPPEGTTALGARVPVQLTNIHLNGLLWAAGTVSIEQPTRVFGAVVAGQTVAAIGSGPTLEVWYDANLGRGLFRGLPVVYRAPGTWQVK